MRRWVKGRWVEEKVEAEVQVHRQLRTLCDFLAVFVTAGENEVMV